jgi:polysaccharide export outer membrane protein
MNRLCLKLVALLGILMGTLALTPSMALAATANADPVATVAAGTPVVSASPPAADYRLGSGDLLRITVFGYPDLGLDTRVSETGNITYPFIGQIVVAGLSASQAESLIARKLVDANIVKSPQVGLLVVDYQSQKIAVMGQVVKPGQYPLDKSSTVIDALAQAGGAITTMAADEATLIRKDGTKQVIDLIALFNGDPGQNPVILGGDTLFVPKAPQFYIQGEVQRPGVYKLERGMTVAQAAAAGGGLTARGTLRRVTCRRKDKTGKEQTGSIKAADPVAADDVLIVRESLF